MKTSVHFRTLMQNGFRAERSVQRRIKFGFGFGDSGLTAYSCPNQLQIGLQVPIECQITRGKAAQSGQQTHNAFGLRNAKMINDEQDDPPLAGFRPASLPTVIYHLVCYAPELVNTPPVTEAAPMQEGMAIATPSCKAKIAAPYAQILGWTALGPSKHDRSSPGRDHNRSRHGLPCRSRRAARQSAHCLPRARWTPDAPTSDVTACRHRSGT